MRTRNVAVIALVVLVAFSGCAGIGSQADDASTDAGEDGVTNGTDATEPDDPANDSTASENATENDSGGTASDADASGNDSAGNATETDTSGANASNDATEPENESAGNASDANATDTDVDGNDSAGNASDVNATDVDGNDSVGDASEANASDANASNDTTGDDSGANATDANASEENSSGLTDETGDDGSERVDETADAEWSPPEEPNRPLERKDEGAERIESIEFVDTVPASDGEGYSNFNLEIVANTSMENVDPPEHGDVVGEPYFFVKINEGSDEQRIVERTDEVEMTENGTFHIPVRPDGLAEFGEREDLTVEVFLMDEDSAWDDVYDAGSETIHFDPDAGSGESDGTESNGTEPDDGS